MIENKELIITPEIKKILKQTSGWVIFLAVCGFLGAAFISFIAVFFIFISDSYGEEISLAFQGFPIKWIGLVYLLLGVFTGIVSYLLLMFATKVSRAVNYNNQELLTKSFRFLMLYYKTAGIATICLFVLYIILIVFMVYLAVTGQR